MSLSPSPETGSVISTIFYRAKQTLSTSKVWGHRSSRLSAKSVQNLWPCLNLLYPPSPEQTNGTSSVHHQFVLPRYIHIQKFGFL